MSNKYKFIAFFLLATDVVLVITLLIHGHTIAVLNPKGLIALKERDLIFTALALMLLIVLPVVAITFFVAWKYRATNTKDPTKPIVGSHPLVIQVVALRWKWLFIYPKQHIATVNFIQFPVHTPVNFELTADAPMSSFWIPQLSGQIYAMTGMGTHLHVIADAPGDYRGSAAEINGTGFSGMKFVARASSQADFNTWVQSVKKSSNMLNLAEYYNLAKPSENNPVAFYSSSEKNLYNTIIMKFMPPSGGDMPGMQH